MEVLALQAAQSHDTTHVSHNQEAIARFIGHVIFGIAVDVVRIPFVARQHRNGADDHR